MQPARTALHRTVLLTVPLRSNYVIVLPTSPRPSSEQNVFATINRRDAHFTVSGWWTTHRERRPTGNV